MKRSLLLERGKIWTGNPGQPLAESILIRGNRIIAIGDHAAVKAQSSASETLCFDLAGRSVLPGFTDAHLHLTSGARQMSALSLYETRSLADAMERIRHHALSLGPDDWVYAVRFDDSRWQEQRLPTLSDLENLGIPNPVLLLRVCSHIHVANKRAMTLGGIRPGTTREGVRLDEEGNPDGVLLEDAANPLLEKMEVALYGGGKAEGILLQACRKLASEGITTVHPCSAEAYGLAEDIDVYRSLREKDKLPLRIVSYHDTFFEDGRQSGWGDMWIRYGGFKMFLDGSLGGRTAAMTFAYADNESNRGKLNHSQKEVTSLLCEAHRRGVQVQIHAIGDAAIDQVLRGLDETERLAPNPCGLPPRVVHLQVCRPDQMEKLRRHHIVCDIQPSFVPNDIRIANERVGKDRLAWAYAWQDMLRYGLLVTGSSDSPVEPTNPWRGIWSALNRVDDTGEPVGGWRPDQKLTLQQALTIYCVNAHKAIGTAEQAGSLAPEMLADLTVLDRDIEKTPPKDLQEVSSCITLVDGKLSWGQIDDWEQI